jgi:hypothetical protein
MSSPVRDFLLEFKKAVTHDSGVYLVPREDALATLQHLGLNRRNLEEILLSLSVADYCRGPADRDRDGQLWIFAKRLRDHEIYIKLPQINGISALEFFFNNEKKF